MKNKQGYVYFIRKKDKDIFKIGMTYRSPELRLKNIQTSSPDHLYIYGAIYTQNPRKLEGDLHRKFSENRLKGEWFALPEKNIKALLKDHPDTLTKDWIELRQGYSRIFWYQISSNLLFIDLRTFKNFSDLYLASLFCLDLVVIGNALAIQYDILMNDYPEMISHLEDHKNLLLIAAKEYIETDISKY